MAEVLPPGGAAFLGAIAAGRPLAAALGAAGDSFELAATLSLLLAGGAITALTLGNPP